MEMKRSIRTACTYFCGHKGEAVIQNKQIKTITKCANQSFVSPHS